MTANTAPQYNVLNMSDAIIARGIKDWQDEQKSVVQSRARWVNIGKALAEGRMLLPGKVNDRRYGEWLKACGFDNIDPATRSDAIWFVGMSIGLIDIPADMNHPQWIRQWHRSQQVAKPPRPDLDLSEAKVTLNPVDVLGIASKVVRLDAYADETGPEAEIAKKYLAKHAERLGTDSEALVAMAKRLTPEMQASPVVMAALSNNINVLKEIAKELVEMQQLSPLITREYITAVLNSHFDNMGL